MDTNENNKECKQLVCAHVSNIFVLIRTYLFTKRNKDVILESNLNVNKCQTFQTHLNINDVKILFSNIYKIYNVHGWLL